MRKYSKLPYRNPLPPSPLRGTATGSPGILLCYPEAAYTSPVR